MEPKIIKKTRFPEIIDELIEKGIRDKQKSEENEGRCIKCNKKMANPESLINPWQCDDCNEKTKVLLRELKKDSGFQAFKL